jgi:hypothetical protein
VATLLYTVATLLCTVFTREGQGGIESYILSLSEINLHFLGLSKASPALSSDMNCKNDSEYEDVRLVKHLLRFLISARAHDFKKINVTYLKAVVLILMNLHKADCARRVQ